NLRRRTEVELHLRGPSTYDERRTWEAEYRVERRAKRAEPRDVRRMQQPFARRRHVEQQFPVATHRREVQTYEIARRADARVLCRVMEPAGTDRDVDFCGAPHGTRPVAVLQVPLAFRAVGA